ncbi:hypothetical protein SPRG_01585 [Saprolegnia parasitica CBS 223.65]|uniref:WRKY19-like zinc finger domain-containing protein n=1 Tax=Saprolegnia parasitica (strain CBS 223.65) TaxID=695850 RepID=A0A067D6Y1_SAPPC|nr:hypothetical protein SPRG_01585 [Saprolegnia parasitica CBS 223.65]KDO34451.1 hypothetical protein SPRG_01585 [Saprolegnia parasitica CBS 223.65]|eukprot:XP_012195181.1 hypothetical protein SPRG_01585 [Saprolegnia parasitica CBS 223.65]
MLPPIPDCYHEYEPIPFESGRPPVVLLGDVAFLNDLFDHQCSTFEAMTIEPIMICVSATADLPPVRPARSLSTCSSVSFGTDSEDGDALAKKVCSVPECHRAVRSRGVCKRHGGGKKCIVANCGKEAQNGSYCVGHGGGKSCKIDGCVNASQSQGLCKAHGGGARCKYAGCDKSSQGGGLCRAHGGGKRCNEDGCMKGAQRGNKCARHGGCRTCTIGDCNRTDRGGGLCEIHRQEKCAKSPAASASARALACVRPIFATFEPKTHTKSSARLV